MPNSANPNPRPPEKPVLSWPQRSSEPPAAPLPAKPLLNHPVSAARPSFPYLAGAAFGGFLVGVIAIIGFQHLSPSSSSPTDKTASSATSSSKTAPAVSNAKPSLVRATVLAGYAEDSVTPASVQKAGYTVTLSSIAVSAPTWAVVYDDNGGFPGNALGAALFFPDSASGEIRLLRATESGKKYYVGLQTDDGDHFFSLHGDAQVIDENGRSVLASFMVQ